MSYTTDPFERARRGDADYFQSLDLEVLEKCRDKNGYTLLFEAVMANNLNCCQVISRRCPQLLYERSPGITVLQYAANFGRTEIMMCLLTARATTEQGIKREGETVEFDSKLLMMVSSTNETALHAAAAEGQFQAVKLLLQADPSNNLLRMVSIKKNTALHFAVREHRVEIVELLVQADPDFEYSGNDEGKTPLFMAWKQALSGDQKTADIRKLLIRKQHAQCRLPIGENKWTLIHHATANGDLDTVKEIIHFWSDCCQLVDMEGQNFFHLAVKFQKVNILNCILKLRNIADSVLNGKDNYGNTPLHLAILGANESIALDLLDDSRVSKMVENKQGKKALDAASSALLKKLILDENPMVSCAIKGDVEFFSAIHIDVLGKWIDENGESILFTAVKTGHLNCCEVISKRCPELLHKTIHKAVSNGKDDIVEFLLKANIVDLLIMPNNDHCTALHIAAERGNIQSTKLLIEADPSNKLLEMENLLQETALHMAVKEHHLEIVKLLVEAHPDFEYSENHAGYTPLLLALQEASSGDKRTVDIRVFLIQKQSKQCKIRVGRNEWTLLQNAASVADLSAIEEIVQFCPDCLTLVDKDGQNFLHIAAKFDRVAVVKYVLDLTGLPENVLNGKDKFGNTPLHVAISCGNQNTAFALSNDPRVDKMTENMEGKKALDVGSSVLFQYASKGDVDFFSAIQVGVLRKCSDDDDNSLLFVVVSKGYLNCCEVISKRCPELLYKTNRDGVSTLHSAASNGNIEIVKCLLSARGKAEQGVQNLQSQVDEVQIDTKLLMMASNNQRTALHYSVDNGHLMLAKFLIEADSTNMLLKMTDNYKETALHYAVKRHYLEIVKLLVEADSNFEYSANVSGDTPLSVALKEATSCEDPITVDIRVFLIQKQTKQCKIRVGRNRWTLLQIATSVADLSAIEEIIQFCPDCLTLVDKEGQNFLHIAVSSKHENVVNYILGLSDLSDSILNGKNNHGETPLHIATKMGSVSIALSLLYDRRVRKTIQNNNGKNALDAIKFDYDKRRAGVRGLVGEVDEKELKDQSDFDLLVGALISTVSFTAGITVPGGFNGDGQNKGKAILYKNVTFAVFVAFNTIALLLSLFAVFTHFCMKRLVDEKEIILQRKVATVCSIGAIFAMVVAFIMGSIAVLSNSLLLVLIVCGFCSIFFVCAFYSMWRMKRQQRRRRAVLRSTNSTVI